MTGTVRRIVVAGMVAATAAGCVTVSPNLHTAPTTTFVSADSRRPLSVGVVMSDQTRAFSQAHELPTECITGGIGFAPTPYGQTLETALRDSLGRVFDTVAMIRPADPRDGYDALFEAELSDVGFRFGCMISPAQFGEVRGSLRALDAEGREVWRSATVSGRGDVGFQMAFDFGPIVGDAVSKALGQMVDGWTRDVASAEVERYAVLKPAPGRQFARRTGGGRAPKRTAKPLRLDYPASDPRPEDIAVIIGNSDYASLGSDIPDVPPALADAEEMVNYVVAARGVREGNIIFLKDATAAQMARVFGNERDPHGQLYDWVRPGRSSVFVYYAGHGASGGEGGSSYLVPVDADGSRLELNGYPLSALYRNLGQLPAREVTVVLEACFSGISQAGAVTPRASGIYVKPRRTEVPPNVTVIAAGTADQIASWEEDGSHGLFTRHFLEAMAGQADKGRSGNGDGVVSLAEVKKYLDDTLTYYARRYYGRDQTPEIVERGRLLN